MKKYKIVDGKNTYIFNSLCAAILKAEKLTKEKKQKSGIIKHYKIQVFNA